MTPLGYTVPQAAVVTGYSTKTLHRAIADGSLVAQYPTTKGEKQGRPWISHDDLMAWLTGDRKSA